MKERLSLMRLFLCLYHISPGRYVKCVCVSARVCLMVRGNDRVEGRDSNHVHTAYSVL